jgi:hypothetical protein
VYAFSFLETNASLALKLMPPNEVVELAIKQAGMLKWISLCSGPVMKQQKLKLAKLSTMYVT